NRELPGPELFDPGLTTDFGEPLPPSHGPATRRASDASQEGTLPHRSMDQGAASGGSAPISDSALPNNPAPLAVPPLPGSLPGLPTLFFTGTQPPATKATPASGKPSNVGAASLPASPTGLI